MHRYTRRDILRMGAALAAAGGLGKAGASVMAAGIKNILDGQTKVVWLQGLACDGCSISFLNSDEPGPLDVLTDILSLVYHPTLSAAQGEMALELIEKATTAGNYIFVFEGAIPLRLPTACLLGGKPLGDWLPPILQNAKYVVAAGTCAAFGGIPSAEGNPTGAVSLLEFIKHHHFATQHQLINCPGCPAHPQSVLGTLAYLAGKGIPPLDPELHTPNMFFGQSVHDECPRFHHWQKHEFASNFGEKGCLFKLGCLGPLTHTNCPQRQWNSGVNWCVRAGAPCIGCTGEQFAKTRDFPFYRNSESTFPITLEDPDSSDW